MKRILILLCWQSCLLPAVSAASDVVTLKEGRQLFGYVESRSSSEIQITGSDGSQLINIDRLQSIEFDPPPGSQGVTPAARQATMTLQGITLPIGTVIAARTTSLIDSKTADTFTEYAASLDDPIVVDGVTIVPANADAFLRVAELIPSRPLRSASLSLRLVAVRIGGRRLAVNTDKVDSKSGSQAKRTLTGAGVGAAAGAGIGVLAGGPVGAAVGAGAGAIIGGAAGALTGKGVLISPETRFSYTLTQPVTIGDQERTQ